jgi:hypothetical protein
MQGQKLYDRQEQEKYSIKAAVQEVLPALRQTHTPQGDTYQVVFSVSLIDIGFFIILGIAALLLGAVRHYRPVAPTGRAPVSKTGCCGFESCLA